jgi:hypothetical protein
MAGSPPSLTLASSFDALLRAAANVAPAERQASRFSAEPVLIYERARTTSPQAQAESGQLIIEVDRVSLPLGQHGSIDGFSSEFHDNPPVWEARGKHRTFHKLPWDTPLDS